MTGTDDQGYVACIRCGKLLPVNSLYCTSCGADLKVDQAADKRGAVDPGDFKGSGSGFPGGGEASQAISPESPPAAVSTDASLTQPHYNYPAAPIYPAAPGYPAYSAAYRPRKTDDIAIVAIVCAIASFSILPFIPAVAAIALGFTSRERIRKSAGALEGNGIAVAAILVGIANVVLTLAVVVILLAVPLSK